MQQDGAGSGEGVEFRLVVWMGGESGWRASVLGPDATEHEFLSPFELARFLAWPGTQTPASGHGGIR
ncbi:MAG: hypothetical protein ABIX12_08240 [Rubrivivax sp.]